MKTKYSYFRHSQPYCFGNLGGPTFLIRRENKTGEYKVVNYSRKMITDEDKERAEYNIEQGNWVAANQKEINKIKRLYREPKYSYYRHKNEGGFGNPGVYMQYILRRENKTNKFYWMKTSDTYVLNNESADHDNYFLNKEIEKGSFIPATKESIKNAIKLNKKSK